MPDEDEQGFLATPPQEPQKKKSKAGALGVAALCVVCVCVLGLAVVGAFSVWSNYAPERAESSAIAPPVQGNLLEEPHEGIILNDRPQVEASSGTALTTEQIIEKASPSVVTIKMRVSMPDFIGEGVGSGIIFDKAGYIVTNAHVVEYARGLHVILKDDKKEYAAEVIGIDARTDLAIIKIDAEKENLTLIPAEMGNSDQVRVGESILIIGTPQYIQLAGSVTQGIISGLDREVYADDTHYMGLLQMDAAINHGNSGGALINGSGQVIGINSTKYIGEGAEGLGFAISINSAKPILDELRESGKITSRVCLGILMHEVTEEMARKDRMPVGLYVESFKAGSKAISSGVLAGDVITQINTTPTIIFDDARQAIAGKKAGETVRLKINRYDVKTNKNKEIEITMPLIQDIDEPGLYEFFKDIFPEDWEDPNENVAPPKTERLNGNISLTI